MEINCTPTQFESALKSLCERMGLSVQLTKASHDGGVDLHVVDPVPIRGGRYIVQAKRYQGSVGEPIIRDLYGTLLHSGAVKAILITTGYFTDAAEAFAKGKPIELVDGDALEKLIEQFQLHDEFFVNSMPLTSTELPLAVSADELLGQYRTKPADNLVPLIFERLLDEDRFEDAVDFGSAHEEQLLSSSKPFCHYLRFLVGMERANALPTALSLLMKIRFDLLPMVVADLLFGSTGEKGKAFARKHFRSALEADAQIAKSSGPKCRAFAQTYLLLDERVESSQWLDRALQLAPNDIECLRLSATYEIVANHNLEALNKLRRCLLCEPFSTVTLFNYQSAKQGLHSAVLVFAAEIENDMDWKIMFRVSESSVSFLEESPELSKESRRSVLEEVLKGDPHNLNMREALLSILPYDQQIGLGEELAYEIDEQTKATRLPTKIAEILQYAYLQQARESPKDKEAATARGIQWTEYLLKAGVRDVDILYVGASLMFDPDDKGRAAAFLKDHLDVILTNVGLAKLYCNCLKPEDAIPILERVLLEKRAELSRKELDTVHWALAYHYGKGGKPDKAIPLYRLATDFQDKEALSTYLFMVRELKGNPSAYQEALRLLAENGETLATLYGISQECLFNGLWVDQIRHLKKAIAIAPSDAGICSDLASAYGILDQQEEEAYWYKKAALLAGV